LKPHQTDNFSAETGRAEKGRAKRGLHFGLTAAILAVSLLAVLVLTAALVNLPGKSETAGVASPPTAIPGAQPASNPTVAPTPRPTQAATFAGQLKTAITYDLKKDGQWPQDMALSPDGQTLVISGKGVVKLWRVADSTLLKTVEVPQSFRDSIIWAIPVWSPDGQTLAVAYYYQVSGPSKVAGTVEFWSASGERRLQLEGFNEEALGMFWSPDSKLLATTGSLFDAATNKMKNSLRLWSSDGKLVRTIIQDQPVSVHRLAWSPDSKLIATDSQDGVAISSGTLQLWQTDGKLLAGYDFKEDQIEELAWSPDGKWLAVGRATMSDNLRLYNRQQMEAKQPQSWVELSGHTDFITEVTWAPDSQTLATSSVDQTVRLWDATKANTLATLPGGQQVIPLAWSPDGNLLATGTNGHQLQFWNKTGKSVKTIEEKGMVLNLYWLPDGRALLSVSDGGTINMWQR
jgi:WD40 repeat protein